MDTNYENWELKDFTLFLLIHSAASDLNIAIEEKELIYKKFTEENYDSMLEFYKDLTDFDKILIVHHLKDEVIKDEKEREELYHSIEELFNIDGDYSDEEKNLMIALKTILDD